VEDPLYLVNYLEKYCAEDNLSLKCLDVLTVIFNLNYEDQHHFQTTRNPDDLKQAIDFGHEFINCIKNLLDKTARLPRSVIKNSIRENEYGGGLLLNNKRFGICSAS